MSDWDDRDVHSDDFDEATRTERKVATLLAAIADLVAYDTCEVDGDVAMPWTDGYTGDGPAWFLPEARRIIAMVEGQTVRARRSSRSTVNDQKQSA